MTRSMPAAVASDDSVVLARVADGDVRALADIYDRHAPALLAFAVRIVGRTDSEDVLQTTFERVVRIARSYDGRGESARSWLFGVMARVAQERRRSVARFARAMLRLEERTPRAFEASRHVERLAIEKALERVKPQKRIVLVLADVEGYTAEQIAEMLGVPVGTVWTRLHHARKELRAFYGSESS